MIMQLTNTYAFVFHVCMSVDLHVYVHMLTLMPLIMFALCCVSPDRQKIEDDDKFRFHYNNTMELVSIHVSSSKLSGIFVGYFFIRFILCIYLFILCCASRHLNKIRTFNWLLIEHISPLPFLLSFSPQRTPFNKTAKTFPSHWQTRNRFFTMGLNATYFPELIKW